MSKKITEDVNPAAERLLGIKQPKEEKKPTTKTIKVNQEYVSAEPEKIVIKTEPVEVEHTKVVLVNHDEEKSEEEPKEEKKERRTEHISLVLKRSMVDQLKQSVAKSMMEGKRASVNSLIEEAIAEYLNK